MVNGKCDWPLCPPGNFDFTTLVMSVGSTVGEGDEYDIYSLAAARWLDEPFSISPLFPGVVGELLAVVVVAWWCCCM